MFQSSRCQRFRAFVVCLLLFTAVGRGAEAAEIGTLRLIGLQTLPRHIVLQGTVVGGLSGIDYQQASDLWIAESDDRSDLSPARYYALEFSYDETKLASVSLQEVTFFQQPDGSTYPNKTQFAAQGGVIPDLESVRYDPFDGSLWYTSEGDRTRGINPFVRQAARDGSFLAELPLPEMFEMHPKKEIGPRQNLVFEGLTFASDGYTLWVAMEGPLFQDGPLPTAAAGAVSRLTHLDRAGKVLGQFAYPIDPIPAATATDKWADNGVSEMLAVSDHEFLILERSGSQDAAGVLRFRVRIYEADVESATDISGIDALEGAAYRPATKKLLLDFDTLGAPWVDNLEGLTWGPRLANGHATLMLVSDDNFSENEETQFWAFEVIPADAPVAVASQCNQGEHSVTQNP